MIIFLIVTIICLVFMVFFKPKLTKKLDQCFYKIDQLDFNFLHNIEKISSQISTEVNNLKNEVWYDWPEKKLYYKNTDWKIFPFFGFNYYSSKNLRRCPFLTQFLQSIPGIKLAALSKMGPFSELKSHQGWGIYSNNVIRCHFGINVPNGCFMHVYNGEYYEKQLIVNGQWTIFDDSKMHYASNTSNKERIVLIIDIERPQHVKKGQSKFNETDELDSFIKQFDS